MANNFLLIIDGSSLLSTQYYGNLPKEILYAKSEEARSALYHKLMQTSRGVYTNGVYGFMKVLLSIIQYQKPQYLAVCWDLTRNTFRRDIYQEYKGNRKDTPEPLKQQFALCQQLLKRIGIAQFMSEDYEADDYAGSLSRRFKQEVPVRIMTKDRDYLQLVEEQVHLWMVTSSVSKAQEFYKRNGLSAASLVVPDNVLYLTPELVQKEFGFPPEKTVMVKQLAGDTADNIPGVKGIGEKTAVSLANAYSTIEQMYDEIRDLDEQALSSVKKRWKEELGIKRSPLKYLLAQSEEELVGEKASVISKELATIKTDIDLSGVSLQELKTYLNIDELEKEFHELEFHSLSCEQLGEEFCSAKVGAGYELHPYLLDKEEKVEKELKNAFLQNSVSLCVLKVETKKEPVQEGQLDLFQYMQEQIVTTVQETTTKIIAVSFSFQQHEAFVIKGDAFTQEQLKSYITRLYEADCTVSSFDVKEQLSNVPDSVTSSFILKDEEEKMPAFDLSVAAYLLNPLKGVYPPVDICMDYNHKILDAHEILGKQITEEICLEKNDELINIMAQEAEAAYVLTDVLTDKLKEKGMWDLFLQIEMPTVYTLYEMEKNGIHVERAALKQYGNQLTGNIEKLEQQIYEKAGRTFNIQSPKQLGIVLFEEMGLPKGKKTKTGYSTSAEVLEKLRYDYDIVDDILNYRQLTKLRSTYAEGLENYIQNDERIHGHFNQTVTATGRLSSTEPNLQNIPMRTELGRAIRKVFLPEEGAVFLDADYSQIELRVLAHMSGDETLIQAFRDGVDIHALTASEVFHVPFDEVTSLMRRNAKAVNFGIVYGISAHGLSVDLGISRKEANDYMEGYFATYPKVKEFLDNLVEEAKKEGEVRTMFGRVRPIPELYSSNFNQRNFGERVAMNSPIQGTAADIMKIAMNRTYRGLRKANLKSRLVLQIHDELLVETYVEEKEQVKQILEDAMIHACKMKVELIVDSNEGANWYDAK